MPSMMNYGTNDWDDAFWSRWLENSIPEGIRHYRADEINGADVDVEAIADMISGTIVQVGNETVIVASATEILRVWSTVATLCYTAESKFGESIAKTLEAMPRVRGCNVHWFRMTPNGIDATVMPLAGSSPVDAFYPWLGQSLESFWAEYMASDASVLLLMGPPGTGKTSFLRGLLYQTKAEAWVTYDESVQRSESLYTMFASIGGGRHNNITAELDEASARGISRRLERALSSPGIRPDKGEDPTRILILEDSDQMLGSRGDGNNLMSRILNLADGLVKLPRRKVIFTTNLPNLSSVDEALLRPGRCFGVLNFRRLDRDEAVAAAAAVGVDRADLAAGNYTLAQVLGDQKKSGQAVRKIGF